MTETTRQESEQTEAKDNPAPGANGGGGGGPEVGEKCAGWFRRNWGWFFVFVALGAGFAVNILKTEITDLGEWVPFLVRWMLIFGLFIFVFLFTQPLVEGSLKQIQIQHWMVYAYAFMIFAIAASIYPFVADTSQERKVSPEKTPIAVFQGCSWDDDIPAELYCGDKKSEKKPPKKSEISNKLWIINVGGSVTACPNGKSEDSFCVNGGLPVPLYFVILALIGGAVSLTRRIPELQKRSTPHYISTDKEPKVTPGECRERLVFQIIQFISAPFLAIVAYYIVKTDSPTTTVALAFGAGFSSESVLLMVRAGLTKITPTTTSRPCPGGVSGTVRLKGGESVADARIAVVGHAQIEGKTDDKGHYVLNDVPQGEYSIEVDYKKQKKVVKVSVESGKTKTCHVQLP